VIHEICTEASLATLIYTAASLHYGCSLFAVLCDDRKAHLCHSHTIAEELSNVRVAGMLLRLIFRTHSSTYHAWFTFSFGCTSGSGSTLSFDGSSIVCSIGVSDGVSSASTGSYKWVSM
jgi:hypothetical protein